MFVCVHHPQNIIYSFGLVGDGYAYVNYHHEGSFIFSNFKIKTNGITYLSVPNERIAISPLHMQIKEQNEGQVEHYIV